MSLPRSTISFDELVKLQEKISKTYEWHFTDKLKREFTIDIRDYRLKLACGTYALIKKHDPFKGRKLFAALSNLEFSIPDNYIIILEGMTPALAEQLTNQLPFLLDEL